MKPLVAAAVAGFAAIFLGGCSCNTTNTFDDQYCNTYAGITPLPAFLMGVGFFVFLFLAVVVFQRLTRPPADVDAEAPSASARAPSGPPWHVNEPDERAPSAVLADLAMQGADVRVSERFDGAWLVEVRVPDTNPPFGFVSTWTTREAASREALHALVGAGLVRPGRGD